MRSSPNGKRRPNGRQPPMPRSSWPRGPAAAEATAPARPGTGSSVASRRAARPSSSIRPNGRIPYLNDAARQRARRRGQRANDRQPSVRRPGCARPVRSLHHARPAARHLPDHLQQHVADRAGTRLRRDPLRDDSRHAGDPDRRRPAVSPTIRQYFGDSRGHWEGDTLVVDVTNFPTNMINYRGAGGGLRLTERFRRVDARRSATR